jgi:hypothetical protein
LVVIAFDVIGAADIIIDYYHGTQFDLAESAGQLAASYATPITYVPILMVTRIAAFYLLVRPQSKAAPGLTGDVAAP